MKQTNKQPRNVKLNTAIKAGQTTGPYHSNPRGA